MTIEKKVKLVEQLFDRLEIESKGFQSETGLHCISGCGKCCTTPHIEASPLEFLPWAFHLYLNGQAEIVLDELNQTTKKNCHIYRPLSIVDSDNGSCSNYKYRGLICRLFGYAASRDQFGKLRIATCKIIKENQAENYNNTAEAILANCNTTDVVKCFNTTGFENMLNPTYNAKGIDMFTAGNS